MRKIGIDARLFSQTGVGTYLQNLLYYLDKKNNKEFFYLVYLTKEDYQKINFRSKNIIKKIADYKWHTFSEQIGFLFTLLKDKLDLVHFTYFSYPFLYFKPFIATIHDLTPLLFKTGKTSSKNQIIYLLKYFIYKLGLTLMIKRAKKIITPTLTVKKQLVNFFKMKKDKIIVTHCGVSHLFFNNKEDQTLKQKFKNFFIYVGNFYPHKNVDSLISAFVSLRNKMYRLILIGPDDYFSKILDKKIRENNWEEKILIYKNPNISEMIYFYKNAVALIHPSLSEGFGLPLVEAAYFNCPIIASKIKVFQEILGNNYVFFNPYDIKDIQEKIIFFIKNKPKYNYQKILKKFSFEKMAGKTLVIYEKVLNELEKYENGFK